LTDYIFDLVTRAEKFIVSDPPVGLICSFEFFEQRQPAFHVRGEPWRENQKSSIARASAKKISVRSTWRSSIWSSSTTRWQTARTIARACASRQILSNDNILRRDPHRNLLTQ
jgi:hypothetical protein